ncbi:membrane protein [Fervidicella metallireducens AeB]|uniref:Membrane protein n=1 Tax=Fervidicella metallireducens AeB TaxID=1403537 RepID=A0A017RZ50_9CLOT|nr:lactate utilization protein [Fervidicella metallireducens]EYE89215.1 membrane protein [Fervidicella metallireducens AeB]
MDKNVLWYREVQLEKTKQALEKNNYEVYIVEKKDDVNGILKDIIPKNSTVSFGGSMSIIEAGAIEYLRNNDYHLLDRYKEGLSPDDIGKLYRESFFADFYITSSNAITENGELVNLDGNGNRVAAMIFGPKKIVIIAGWNKIVKNLDDAYERVRNYASPINSKRLNRKTPCVQVGNCVDCSSDERICTHYVVTYRQNTRGRGIVILVKEDIGF